MATISGVFMGCLIVLVIANIFIVSADPLTIYDMTIGAISSILVGAFAAVIIGALSPNSSSVRIAFGLCAMLLLVIAIPISLTGDFVRPTLINRLLGNANKPISINFQIGVGLGTNVLNVFATTGDIYGLGYIFTVLLIFITIMSGLVTIVVSHD